MAQMLSDVKRRIVTTRQLRKVTSTLQKVASARLGSSRRLIEEADVYYNQLCDILKLAYRALPGGAEVHPFIQAGRGIDQVLVVFGADRGLCGPFNTILMNRTAEFRRQHANRTVHLFMRGKVVYRRAKRKEWPHVSAVENIDAIVDAVMKAFLMGQCKEVHVLYWKYMGGIRQEVRQELLLPMPVEWHFGGDKSPADMDPGMIEPSPQVLLNRLLPEYVRRTVHNCFYHSMAAENAARQMSMSRATDNAGDLINELTRQYSRLRQESITTEMLELVAGMGSRG